MRSDHTGGHLELILVEFDPAVLSDADLLRVFSTIHEPMPPNRQGNDVGSQYRSAIYTTNDTQHETARAVMAPKVAKFRKTFADRIK